MNAPTATRQRLVSTAGDLFRRQGYHATGLSQIVKESGAPRGSLYHFFPGGKEELACAALEASAAQFRAGLLAEMASVDTLEEKVRATFDFVARELETSGFEAGCPVATVTLEASSKSALHAVCAGYFEQWRKFVEGMLVEGGIETKRAVGFSTVMLSAIEGAMLICRARKSTEPLEQVRDALTAMLPKNA